MFILDGMSVPQSTPVTMPDKAAMPAGDSGETDDAEIQSKTQQLACLETLKSLQDKKTGLTTLSTSTDDEQAQQINDLKQEIADLEKAKAAKAAAAKAAAALKAAKKMIEDSKTLLLGKVDQPAKTDQSLDPESMSLDTDGRLRDSPPRTTMEEIASNNLPGAMSTTNGSPESTPEQTQVTPQDTAVA